MATKKVPDTQAPANTPESFAAVREVFGKHPVDVIDPIEWGADTLAQLSEMLGVIVEATKKEDAARYITRIQRLAEAGMYLANDMANTMDCEHEDMRDRLRACEEAATV